MGKLQKLRHLHLDHNQLKTLPKEIGYLKDLELLDLSNVSSA
ncbi:leucine-rich repeat domain-containing protein [Leptospira noguchii]|nr:leucine-rich repeat domain-containing protein [Leptospira noguchii]UOG39470.1 leucine-rich repeat domain-containing protein [Leptospira noguchii]